GRSASRSPASSRVMRPRWTASSSASCRRSRVRTTTARGSIKRWSCSRTGSCDGLGLERRPLEAVPERRLAEVLRAPPVEAALRFVERLLDEPEEAGFLAWGIEVPSLEGSDLPRRRSSRDEELEQGLLGVPTVLGLVPDPLARTVQDG